MKKGGSASAVPSFSRSCVIAYLMFQQKVNNVLLTDPATIDKTLKMTIVEILQSGIIKEKKEG